MAIVNFSLPKNLERRVQEAVKRKGFASKAEFFRFAAIYFMDILDRRVGDEEKRLQELTKQLEQELSYRYRGRTLPSVREQLSDI